MEEVSRGTFTEFLEASGEAFDEELIPFFEPAEELVFQVRMPSSAGGEPPGVLAYISPKPGARLPDAWGDVLDQHNLVWVGAENSGNDVHVARRVGLALMAAGVAEQIAPVDHSRVVLSGFSGGGRVASMMMPAYPGRFAGAVFICGANALLSINAATVDALMPVPMVFLTGSGDFNLQDTQMAIATFQQAGLVGTRLMVVDGLGHALPGAEDLDNALKSMVLRSGLAS